jgi:hypothetical protein
MARKEKKYHYIYKTINIITGRYYYGMHSTDNLNDGYIGSGKRLWYSINKYGRENHEINIIKFYPNRNSLKTDERKLVNEDTIKDPMCMNIRIGGEGGLSGLSEESIRKIRKGASNFAYGLWENPIFIEGHKKRTSDMMKKRHSLGLVKYDTFTGKKHSKESKLKMSNTKKGTGVGVNNSQFGTCWITKNDYNKKIKKDDLQMYINEGWIKGRVLR